MPEPGTRDGRYHYLRLLGEGGSGHVWLVEEEERPGSPVALKLLASGGPRPVESLRREFATLSQLVHPNLIQVHALEEDSESGLPRIRMEYVAGVDIVRAVEREGRQLWLDLAAEALRCLAFLHDFGMLHRDLKPANLIVRDRPRLACRLVMLDFGLSARGDETDAKTITAGTLPYIAPELFVAEPASPRSDLYALGTVLFQAIHGRTPFTLKGGETASFIEAVRAGRRARPAVPADYPAGLTAWLEELLAVDPQARPADAREALARFNGAAGTDYPTETVAGRSARLASGPPPGRERELERIWAALDEATTPRVVLLTGEPGSGKKRLLHWLAGDAVARSWNAMQLRPNARSEHDLLRELRDQAQLRKTLALLDPHEPLNSAALDFLDRVATEGRKPPLRVLVAVQPSEHSYPTVRRLLGRSGCVPSVRRIELGPLDVDGIRSLAERSSGGAVSRSKVRWVFEQSEGSPERAAAILVDGDWERGGRSSRRLDGDRSFTDRLAELSPVSVAWLRSLSALGGAAEETMIAELAALAPEASREAVAESLACGLVRSDASGYRTESSATADRVLLSMPESERAKLIANAAHCWERADAAPDPFLVARLHARAGQSERAIETSLEAVDRALGIQDAIGAAEGYAFALRQLKRRDPRRLDLRRRQADALRAANLPRAAARAYGGALALTRSPVERSELLAKQASMLVQAGRFDRGRAAADEALVLARLHERPDVVAHAERAIGIQLARTGRGDRARTHLERAVIAFRDRGDRLAEAQTVQALALCEVNAGLPEAEEHFRRAVELYRQLGLADQGLINLVGLAGLELRAGRYDGARKLLDGVLETTARAGDMLLNSVAAFTLTRGLLSTGAYGEAIMLAHECEDQALFLGDERVVYGARATRAEALIRCGRPAEAAALLESTLARGAERVDPIIVELCRIALAEARIHLSSVPPDETRTDLEASVERLRELESPDEWLYALCVELDRRARSSDAEPLTPVYDELSALLGRGGSWDQPFYRARAELTLARWHLNRERGEEALDLARGVLERIVPLNLPGLAAEAAAVALAASERSDGPAVDDYRATGEHHLELAAERIGSADLRQGFLENPVFRALRKPPGLAPAMGQRLSTLYEMTRALNSGSDPELLLASILDMALRVVKAERGLILLRGSDGEFSVRVARNLEQETIRDAERFSRSVVLEAGSGKSVLAVDAEHDTRIRDFKSVSLYGIRSVLCVPLRSRGRIVGAVYVDSRAHGSLFDRDDLRFLEAFADHAALALENARIREGLEKENLRLQELAESRARFGNLIGDSAPMRRVFELIEKVAASELPVLIRGESGTGKELVARAIHFNGPRCKAPLVSENCAAIPDTLLQSELFGHVRGAFTGAERDRTGLFEQADGGTLFLDEIGDTSPSMQAQLLRVLQEGEIRRVGGDRQRTVDVRIIAATHRHLRERVETGLFREDLLYRLEVLPIDLPPLRDRGSDIALLVAHFLQRIARGRGREAPSIAPAALDTLTTYSWPGNVRQLENVLQRLTLNAGEGAITQQMLEDDPGLGGPVRSTAEAPPSRSLERSERERIGAALRASGGNRARAARMLGISRATIYRKIREHRLQ